MKIPPAAHPRLMLSRARISALRQQSDPVSLRLSEGIIRVADHFLDAPPLEYVKEGRRLLYQSRRILLRVLNFSVAALLTGDRRYTDRACEQMNAAAEFPDWNPSHFLDTAEMTLALSLGYDWLYAEIEPALRDKIAHAILEKGLRASVDSPPEWLWWIKGDNNWNQVCHSGMAAGALAIAELDPELAGKIVERAIEHLPIAADAYRPDGAYAEGPMYWSYGTSYHVILLALLESVFGHHFQLDKAPGFLESARYIALVTGPGGRFFNYCDADEKRSLMPPLFWFAARLGDAALVRQELDALDGAISASMTGQTDNELRFLALALVWWEPELEKKLGANAALPLHWSGAGVSPVASHRSAWGDARALWLAIKGGSPSSNHAHMDGGAFVLEADGVRWAIDLGRQNYHSLESAGLNLWDKEQASDRWRVFRLGTDSHNVLTFNGAPQRVDGRATIVKSDAAGTFLDLTELYRDHAARVSRAVSMHEGRIDFQDGWSACDEPLTVRWQMLTRADIAIDGREIELTENGERLRLAVVEPMEVTIEVIDVSRPVAEFDTENPGAKKLVVTCRTAPREEGRLRIVATPGSAKSSDALIPIAHGT